MPNSFQTEFSEPPEEEEEPVAPTLAELVASPKKVVTDEGSVEERSMDEIIKGDQYLAAKEVTGPLHGLVISRFKPNGAAGH